MNPKVDEMGISFATFCPSFSETDMAKQAFFSEDPNLLFYDLHKEAISNAMDKFGINRYIPLLLLYYCVLLQHYD